VKNTNHRMVSEAGSIELVALGFCAALVVLLAIPLLEACVSDVPNSSTSREPAPIENSVPHQ